MPIRHAPAGWAHGLGQSDVARELRTELGDVDSAGPREDPTRGFRTFPEPAAGEKRRIRSDTFADHYSQARQFYFSQTRVEQQHIIDAFTFELGKCERVDIRERMLANLMNVDEDLASAIGDGLGIDGPITANEPARVPRSDLSPSPALSIVNNGPDSLAGRKLGILLTDDADADVLTRLFEIARDQAVTVEIIAPKVGGVTLNDGQHVPAQQSVEGGPSVLYDVVAVLAAGGQVDALANNAAAKDFCSDAYAHAKFVGYAASATPLIAAAGIVPDEGFVALDKPNDVSRLFEIASALRLWTREALIHQT
jgi:catalase